MSQIRDTLRRFDRPLLVGVAGVLIFGLLAIASVDLSHGGTFTLLQKQLTSLAVGLVVALAAALAHPEFFRSTSRWWYVAGLILLASVLFFGVIIRGTRGWFLFGPFSFQPVEFMKVALVLVMARIIDRRGRAFRTALFFFGTALIAGIPLFLVFAQPDLGGSVVLGAVWLWLVLFVGTKRAYILLLVSALVATAALGWFVFLKPYQKDRVLTFIQRDRDIKGAGYNVQQSVIAVGSGNFFGRGFGYGSQNQLDFVPERQTDFIFSVIGEEFGFVGVITFFACYTIIGWRLMVHALLARDDFTLVVLVGALGLFLTQVFINIGGAVGILPVTGIALPLVSYGGSSLMMHLLLIGIVQGIAAHQVTQH